MHNPLVTVLMPVYNGSQYLTDSIESILNQTFTDFEFLIIDDGSSDKSAEIIKSYNDPRIKFVQNETNLGLITTLNKGLELASGQYVARMDCDDISLIHRLQLQVQFMNDHPEVGICGTWYETFGNSSGKVRLPVDYETIKSMLFFNSYLAHPTVMLRMSNINKYKLRYNPAHLHAEDYGLWIECSLLFPIANIPTVLLKYRISNTNISSVCNEQQKATVQEIHINNLKRLGIHDIDKDTLQVFESFVYFNGDFSNSEFIMKVKQLVQRLKDANKIKQYYPEPCFSNILTTIENAICGKISMTKYHEQILHANKVELNTSETGYYSLFLNTNQAELYPY